MLTPPADSILSSQRSRMIAASFLAKDLMIDWRLGERYL